MASRIFVSFFPCKIPWAAIENCIWINRMNLYCPTSLWHNELDTLIHCILYYIATTTCQLPYDTMWHLLDALECFCHSHCHCHCLYRYSLFWSHSTLINNFACFDENAQYSWYESILTLSTVRDRWPAWNGWKPTHHRCNIEEENIRMH